MGEWEYGAEGLTGDQADEIAAAADDLPDDEDYGVSENEGRKLGMAIDVPHEAGSPNPRALRYRDLGGDKKWGGEIPDHLKTKAEREKGVSKSGTEVEGEADTSG